MLNRLPFWIAALLFSTTLLHAADTAIPVAVRHTEGPVRGFLLLRSAENNEVLAIGEILQVIQKDHVKTHLVFNFKDGSLYDETVAFSQSHSFRLQQYSLVQKGPSFPNPLQVSMNGSSGQVTVHYTEDGKEKESTSTLKLPITTANGMLPILVKNLSPGEKETKLAMVAFTPKPQVVTLAFTPEGEDSFSVAGSSKKATRYNMKIEIGGVKGVIAPLVGKQPPDTQLWVMGGEVPAFVGMQGALFYGGPIWRIELASPVFGNEAKKPSSNQASPKK